MIVLFGCEGPGELAEAAQGVIEFAAEHPELTADIRLRISCVGIGLGGLSRSQRRRLLAEHRMQHDHVVVRRFWVSLDKRRMYASRSPWSFAPGFELNPCDPDENVFVTLIRRDRYLSEEARPAPTDDFHRTSITRERTFLSGLVGRRVLVRTLIVVNVLIWLALELCGGSTDPALLVRAGAKVNGLIGAGQLWRFVTPIFLHFGFLHLVLNSAGLLFLGEVLERIYGTSQFALLYFVAGIVSVIVSFHFGHEVMVGASGAIFGLAGALVVYGYRYRSRIPRRYGAMFGGAMLPLIAVNIAFGILVRGIDNSAHLGGLAAGVLAALLLRPLADEVTPTSWTSPGRLLSLLVTGLVLGSLLTGGVFFLRHKSIYDIDRLWMTSQDVPGDLSVGVPRTWVRTGRTPDRATFQSVCYKARLEVLALDASKGPSSSFLNELRRLQTGGFRIVGPGPWITVSLMGELFSRGRVQVLMEGAKGRQRQQVFLLSGKALISVGVELTPKSEHDAARFATVRDRMLAALPEPG